MSHRQKPIGLVETHTIYNLLLGGFSSRPDLRLRGHKDYGLPRSHGGARISFSQPWWRNSLILPTSIARDGPTNCRIGMCGDGQSVEYAIHAPAWKRGSQASGDIFLLENAMCTPVLYTRRTPYKSPTPHPHIPLTHPVSSLSVYSDQLHQAPLFFAGALFFAGQRFCTHSPSHSRTQKLQPS
ncbi:unnamed protein product [Cuscuta campestris]|uniref:Uncharacterized protein n=1 Tax=Cuscuta campestris TaxID=132261 RepID=A0A484KAJ3_9ASTE|nr:unnamed protein product [Cuscuta campestris]